jgi:hypothetical protein
MGRAIHLLPTQTNITKNAMVTAIAGWVDTNADASVSGDPHRYSRIS